MKKRINVYLPEHIEQELEYLSRTYNKSASYLLLLAYKLTDRESLEKLLQL